MTTATHPLETKSELPGSAGGSVFHRLGAITGWRRLVMYSLAGVVTLGIVRVITGADDLTSSGTMGTTLRLAMPILLAGLSGLWAERSGVVNIGLEGMMILGAWCGGFGAWQWGPWWGLLFGIFGGMIGGLIHAVATVTFNVDHIVSGVSINILAAGVARYLSAQAFVDERGGGLSQSPPQKSSISTVDMPFLAGGEIFGWKSPDILYWFESRQWPVIGDAAGILRGVMHGVSLATLASLALVAVTAFVLWRTRLGLRIRSSGEAPQAADSVGVSVLKARYIALLASGGLAGMGGAYLSIVASSTYREGQTGGRGFIGLATMIFGNWRPGGLLGGSLLFGYSDALRLRDKASIPALFLFVAIILVVVAVILLRTKRMTGAVTAGVFALLFALAWLFVDTVPQSLTAATPFVVTLIVLAAASQRLRPPAAAGQPYRKGDSH